MASVSSALRVSPPRTLPARAGPLRQAAPVFAALGDETRLRLISSLCTGSPRSIAELTAETDISRQAVTKHLRVLRKAGLARDTKSGRQRLWQLESGRLHKARRSLDLIAEQWDEALGRLQSLVEAESS